MNSLRQKIALGYAAIGVLVVGLSVFSFLELRALENRVLAGEHVGEFLSLALEMRRFEKNYFLYRQEADLAESRSYVEQARTLLRERPALFEALDEPAHIARLTEDLRLYAQLMEQYPRKGGPLPEGRIRQVGKEIVTHAEDLSRAERRALQTQVDLHRRMLLASVVAVALLAAAVIASLSRSFNEVIRQLELRHGQLVRSEKLAALGTLLSGVAHELNNPLSNISSSCEILAEEMGEAVLPFHRELIGQIDDETWRARRIVRSLLDYARDREFRKEPLPLAQLLEETLRLVKGQIPARVTVARHVADDLVVAGDKQRLQQVFFNLVGNAVEAVDGAGEIVIGARRIDPAERPASGHALVFGQCTAQGGAVEIEVRDNGHGIPADILPRIFDPFFTTKEVGKGLGLGLFIVFEIVEEHGGCIAVESEPGKGTAFFVRLPLERA